MPRFDFRCSKCETVFEDSIPFGSKSRPACPKCGNKNAEKLLAPPPGIVFKGSGFYKTDSRPAESAQTESAPAKDGAPAEKTAKDKPSGESSSKKTDAPSTPKDKPKT